MAIVLAFMGVDSQPVIETVMQVRPRCVEPSGSV